MVQTVASSIQYNQHNIKNHCEILIDGYEFLHLPGTRILELDDYDWLLFK